MEKYKEYEKKKTLEKNEISRTHPVYSVKITDFYRNTFQPVIPVEALN